MNIKKVTSSSNLAFIVGAPRSGTTLLMSILNSHPEIHIVPEFKFYLFYLNKYKNTKFTKKSNRLALVDDFYKYLNHKQSIESIFDSIIEIDKNIVNEFIETDLIFDYNDAIKILYCSISMAKMRTTNPIIILEKNPAYTQHINSISQINPQAKYIGIVRDHRAAVSSRIVSNEKAVQNIQYYAKYWELINNSLYKHAESNPQSLLIIHYQDLLNQSKITIKVNQRSNKLY